MFSRCCILPDTSASENSQGNSFTGSRKQWKQWEKGGRIALLKLKQDVLLNSCQQVEMSSFHFSEMCCRKCVYNKMSSIWNKNRKDMLGCELLDGSLRLLLESQSGFTFTRILHHHLHHLHRFARRKQISHQCNSREWKGTQNSTILHFPTSLPKLNQIETHLNINTFQKYSTIF